MIITAVSCTLFFLAYLLPAWILIFRHKPAKAAAIFVPNLVSGPLCIGLVLYALLTACNVG